VSFDVPYPPDYGGVIDVMYKIRTLSEQGARIHLHCFRNEREAAPELEELCERVDYYSRRTGHLEHLSYSPYIVNSRRSRELKKRILRDPGPILFEGLHTCHPLADPELRELPKWVRTHNIEHEYYRGLMASTRSPLKRQYYRIEAAKLQRFEKVLAHADLIWAISPREKEYFERYTATVHLPPFHPYEEVGPEEEDEGFTLYHGKLSVPENERAALFLIEEVFPSLKSELVIAGNGASDRLLRRIEAAPNVRYEKGGSPERIDSLVQKAHINILPTFQATGIKLKLLAALFKGRHCIVNPPMVEGTGLEKLCLIGEDGEGLRDLVEACSKESFGAEAIEERRKALSGQLDKRKNADLLIRRPEWPLRPSNPRT
jgi:hypothetical protein